MGALDTVVTLGVLLLILTAFAFLATRTTAHELTADGAERIGLRSPWWPIPAGFCAVKPRIARRLKVMDEGGHVGFSPGHVVLVPKNLTIHVDAELEGMQVRATLQLSIMDPTRWATLTARPAIAPAVRHVVAAALHDTASQDADEPLSQRADRAATVFSDGLTKLEQSDTAADAELRAWRRQARHSPRRPTRQRGG